MYRFYSKADETKNRVSIVGECVNGTLKIAAARCSSKDNFVRKKGRELAEQRLANNQIYFQCKTESCDIKQFLYLAKSIAKEIEKTGETIKNAINGIH